MAMLVITRGLLHVKAKPPNLDHLRSLVLQVIHYIYFDPYPDDGNSCDYTLVLFFWFAFEHGHLKVDLPTYGKSADFS